MYRLADTMENENNNEEINLLTSLLQPNHSHDNDTAAEELLSGWKEASNSDVAEEDRNDDIDETEEEVLSGWKETSNGDIDDDDEEEEERRNNEDADFVMRDDDDGVDEMSMDMNEKQPQVVTSQDIMSDIDSITQAVSSLEV